MELFTRVNGTLHFVDPDLGKRAILSTPRRLGASDHLRGKGITMAFVDSGFAPHPDLMMPENRILAIYDAVRRREVDVFRGTYDSRPTISAWHGTMTTAVAAGSGYLSKGRYRGIASEADLVLVRTMTAAGELDTPQIARALQWLLENRVRLGLNVVNISVGVDEPTSDPMHPVIRLVDELVQEGVTVVAAAGNNPGRALVPPASAPSAITVGGFNDHNSLDTVRRTIWHSSYGKTPGGVAKPDLLGPSIWLAAPILLGTGVKQEADALFYLMGVDDATLMRARKTMGDFTGIAELLAFAATPDEARAMIIKRIRDEKLISRDYKHVDGTSFAAPIVAAIAAQILQENPDYSPAEVRAELVRTATPIPGLHRRQQGAGAVKAR